MRNGLVGLSFGAGLGVIAGGWWSDGPPAPRSVAASPSVVADCPSCPPCAAADEVDSLLRAQESQIRSLSAEAFGVPATWSDPSVRDRVEAAIDEGLAGCPPAVEALESDCSEPPCLVALSIGTLRVNDLDEACPSWDVLGVRGSRTHQLRCDGADQQFTVLQVTAGVRNPATPEARARVDTRQAALAELFACR